VGSVIAIANQKGGVGKTTTAVHVGAYLGLAGPVLLVDCDPQANATSWLGQDPGTVYPSVYEALMGEVPLADTVRPTDEHGLWLAPASHALAGAQVELVDVPDREWRLREALAPVRSAYELIVLDCPPSLGLLTLNALAAADALLIPVQCEYLALEGLGQLTQTLEAVRRALNPALKLGGLLLTMYDSRTKLCQDVAAEVRSHFSQTFRTLIPRSVRVSEAPSHGLPINKYAPSTPAAKAYAAFAAEVIESFLPNVEPKLAKAEAKR
jgi:chromosome partitioning protein